MQLSSSARRAVAAGLAFSTIVWSVSLFALPFAFAAPHSNGCLVNASGTIWLVDNGMRRGFPSAEVFSSNGYNFSQVVTANSDDTALPVGSIVTYADGTLVKGPSDPLVYLVANGQKRGFVSGSVFTGLGFSFGKIWTAAVNTFADLPTGANLESATERHTTGVLVKDGNGTVWKMTATGRMGIPSMEVFNSYGYTWDRVVNANAADLASANEGVVAARPGCAEAPGPITGAVTVSAAGPASTTLITNQGSALLASFNFMGNGTVTAVTLKRTGVSADTSLEDVFLFDGSTRITDSASVSQGNINFTNSTGLFTVSGSKMINVVADMSASSGETLGVQLTGVTLVGGSSVGGLPVSGPTHTIATATLAGVALSSPTDSGDSDPGVDILLWQGTAGVTTRDVYMNRLSLRNIGSINNNDIRNLELLVDGQQVGTAAGLDANGYVTFTFNRLLQSGNRTLKVQGDVIGGSSRTVEFSLRGSYDVGFVDSQYNAGVEATGTFPFDSDGFTVSSGNITVVKAGNSPSGNITLNAGDVPMGAWTVTAYGEPIRIETLNLGFTYTDAGGVANAAATLRNARLLINGQQYGSTTTLAPAGTSFTVNYTVNPGTPVTVELRTDVFDNDGADALENGDDIQAFMNNTGSGFKQVSGGNVTIPAADQNANSLNVTLGAMTLTAQSDYSSQVVTIPQSQPFKLGAYNLVGDSTETVNVNTIDVNFDGADEFEASNLSNVYVIYGSTQSSIKSTIATDPDDDQAASWSINYSLAPNQILPIAVYASINTFTVAGGNDILQTGMSVTGVTQASGQTVYGSEDGTVGNYREAQSMTAGTGSLTTAQDAANPVAAISEDNKTTTNAAFRFTAANDAFTITEVTLTMTGTSTVSNVLLKDGGTTVATRPAAASMVISGLNIPVAANTNKTLSVDLQLGAVTNNNTSGENVKVTLTNYRANNGQGEQKTEVDEAGFGTRAGSDMYVFAAIPTLTDASIPAVDPVGTVEVAKWTVTPVGGNVAFKQFGVTLVITENGADATLTAGSFKFYRDGADITDQVAILNAAGATLEDTNSLAEGSSVAYVVFGTEEQLSSARTYSLRTTVAGAWATGDSLRAEIASDAVEVEKDLDGITATGPVELVTSGGAGDTGVQDLIWSDISAIPHAATIGADDATPDSSSDWTNGFLVKNVPLTSWSLTY